jgi:hypothetical protein
MISMKLALIAAALFLVGCSQSNNLVAGRVQNTVAGHKIVVTDCYRTSVPDPQQGSDGSWQWTPCRDADIHIRAGELEVNGKAYGKLDPTDSILVDHGVVSTHKD